MTPCTIFQSCVPRRVRQVLDVPDVSADKAFSAALDESLVRLAAEDPDMAFDACLSAVAPSPATHSRWMELKVVETVRQTGFALC